MTIPPTPVQHRGSAAWSRARSSFYYEGTGEAPVNLRLLRGIDAQFGDAVLRLAADDPLAPPSGRPRSRGQTGCAA